MPGLALYHVRLRADGYARCIRGLRARGSDLRAVRRAARDDLASFAADVRHVLVDGHPVPYWDAPPEFRPWVEGHYG